MRRKWRGARWREQEGASAAGNRGHAVPRAWRQAIRAIHPCERSKHCNLRELLLIVITF